VITSAFRTAPNIRACCESILELTNLDEVESVLVMNEPDEIEQAIVEEFREAYPDVFTVIGLTERESIGASINRGIRAARGEFCALLDADDVRVADSFAREIATLDADDQVDFTYGDFIIVPSQGSQDGQRVVTPEFNREEFTRSCVASPTQLFRKSMVDRVGGFDEQFCSGGDYEFQIRAAMSCGFRRTEGVMCYYTRAGGSASATRMQPLERTAIELRYGLYDKIVELEGYQFVDEAREYRLDAVLSNGEWHPIDQYVPGYAELLAGRAALLEAMEARRARWTRWRPLTSRWEPVSSLGQRIARRLGSSGAPAGEKGSSDA
jgi:glycosyltransferase involved in cell wall biosynthesis